MLKKTERTTNDSNTKNFKVLFVLPDFNYVEEYMPDYSGSFSLGLGYVSAMLKKHEFQTSLIHLTNNIPKKEFVKRIKDENPDLIGFSIFSHQRADAEKYVGFIRDAKINIPIIIGGVHATTDPEDAIRIKGVNYVCVGEGEYPLLDLCNTLYEQKNTTNIPNIWVKEKQKIIQNEIRPLLQNLDELSFPDREMFDYKNLSDTKMGVFNVLATRGCPYNCTYCCNHVYQKIYKNKGKYVRFRKPEFVIQEIKEGLKKYPYLKYVNLEDDAFCLDKKFVKEFSKEFKKKIGKPFNANTRVNLINDEVAKNLSKGGCIHVAVGIESGNQQIREKILKRFMTNEQIHNAIKTCHKYGITVGTYNIIGLPQESIKNVLETIKLNVKSKADSMHVSIFQPYPNTELYNYCIKNKMIKNSKVSTFFGEYLLKNNTITKEEVTFAYKYFYIYAKVYKTIGKLKIIEKTLDKTFTAKKTHKLQLAIYPIMFFITNPMIAIYRIMMNISPKATRKIKYLILGRK
ncbi:MAG: B12-binding domain-containing radical SAM protein [Nanoarchaeota archaeon]|nr:B12-binding domain-containing radical SAM protein [Nanoarchaeota archaeon]